MTNKPSAPQKLQTPRKLLIIGCGDIGQRLASQLDQSQYQITGIRRHCPPDLPYLRYKTCDAGDAEALKVVLVESFDSIVITMTPAERSNTGYEAAYVRTCHHLVTALNELQLKPRLIIFVSSTAVYAQDDGNWVDEGSATEPTSFSGQRLLEAEQIIATSGFNHTLVRFSGIYGPGRNRLIEQVIQSRASACPHYTNRIHADDCAGFLAHLLNLQHTLAPVYIATDSTPTPMVEVVSWIAAQLGIGKFLSDDAINERGNKKLGNQLMLASGYQLLYSDFRAGYIEMIHEYQANKKPGA
jgi:nucleoside-diphosphate-sugar epimerase